MRTTIKTSRGPSLVGGPRLGRALVAGSVLLAGVAGIATAQPFFMDWNTFDGGGIQTSTGGTFFLSGTIGQPDAGTLPDSSLPPDNGFRLYGGYWDPIFTICDSIDFNNDGSFFDPQDIDAFFSVYGEGDCVPTFATCNDIDFNNDGSLFDPCDIAAFLTLYGEGPCTLCGN